jgi:hypothetical protein
LKAENKDLESSPEQSEIKKQIEKIAIPVRDMSLDIKKTNSNSSKPPRKKSSLAPTDKNKKF